MVKIKNHSAIKKKKCLIKIARVITNMLNVSCLELTKSCLKKNLLSL